MIRSAHALIFASALMAGFSPPIARAHHSYAMFDSTKSVTLNGVIKSFEWTNPHAAMFVIASPDASPPEAWSVEMASPGNLKREGWTRDAVKPGDKVALTIRPLRDGGRGGSFVSLTLLATGQVLKNGQLQSGQPLSGDARR